jgi:hypothetical protein
MSPTGNGHHENALTRLERKATVIGQAFIVEDYTAVFMATCQNGHEPQALLIPGLAPAMGACPTCKRGYQIKGFTALEGQPLQVQLTIFQPKPVALGG